MASTAGARFELAGPLRVWAIRRILPIRASRLRVSVRGPERLVSRFGRATPRGTPTPHRS
ncbi:MAG: hypothetical protein AMXMBFR80_18610 [Dehalococcoidia bacterium]|nr:hypothetical protein [Tepidiformaceae bacterium]